MIRRYEFLVYIIIILMLAVLYVACFSAAKRGYGYPGHHGYHRHHSVWYVRHYDESFSPSARENSLDGNKFSKKGLNGGK